MVTRRRLLAAAAATTAALSACDPDGGATQSGGTAPPLDPSSWPSVREQFALAPGVVNMALFAFASHPATVRAAIEKHRAGLDADPYGFLHANEPALERAVADAAAAYLRTGREQIAFTDSTTMGLGLLYSGLRLRPGDEVLATEHDFYATHEALHLRGERDGTTFRKVRLYDEPESAAAEEMVRRLRAAVGARTRVVAVTWVHSGTGVKLPIRAIADALAEVNRGRAEADRLLLCVDGVHGFAVEDPTPDALGCDFLISGCHKWLFGPRGTGLIWGRAEAWRRFTPVIPTFTGEPDGAPGPAATPGGYHSFEHRWALAEAFTMRTAIGATRVAERTRGLVSALKDGLARMSKVRVRTPRSPEVSSGIVCCEVEGYGAAEAVAQLRGSKILASATPYATPYLRFGPTALNDESEVEATLRAVRAL